MVTVAVVVVVVTVVVVVVVIVVVVMVMVAKGKTTTVPLGTNVVTSIETIGSLSSKMSVVTRVLCKENT